MSWLFTLLGKSSGNQAEVTANNQVLVNTGTLDTQAGYVTLACEVDDGEVVGSRLMREPNASIYNRLAVGLDTLLFSDYFNATTQNTALWKAATTTFTFGFGSNGYTVFNSGSVTTASSAQLLQSWRQFTLFGSMPLCFEFCDFHTAVPPTNQQMEAGLFNAPSGSTPFGPTDGVYLRFNSTGVFGVLNFNGTETSVQLIPIASLVLNDSTTYRIVINSYVVEFWGDSSVSVDERIILGTIIVPASNATICNTISAPIGFRLWHNGTAGSAVQWKVANAIVTMQDIETSKLWQHQMAGMGLMGYQTQNGTAMGSTALLTNNLAAGAGAAMTNTTAALGSGLGGQFSALPTLAAGTDGVLCSYQNPTTTVNITGRTLYITGVRVQGLVTTVFTGGPVYYFYALCFGHSAVSLATSEAALTKAPRRIALGYETYVVTAPVGTLGQGVTMSFQTPIAVNPGEFVAITAKNLGTVTTLGVVTFAVTFDSFWE